MQKFPLIKTKKLMSEQLAKRLLPGFLQYLKSL